MAAQVTSVSTVGLQNKPRASKPLLYFLYRRQAFSSLIIFSRLLLTQPSFSPSACLPQPVPLHFSSFHLFSPLSTSPLSSFALSSSASVLSASRIFPWFRFSFPSSITLLSPLPRWSLQPLTRFLPSSFHHSIPFLSLAFSTLRFHSVLPWGFQGGLKRS